MEKRKIAIISHGASGGGSERVATLLANYFAENGNEVFFYAIHSPKREYYIAESVKYEYCSVDGKNKFEKFVNRTKALKKFITDNQIDTMVSFIYTEGISLVGYKKVKKIYSLRNDPNQIHGIKLKLIKRIYRDADYVVFQTEDARDFFDERISSHGIVIPNPIKEGLPEWDKTNHNKEIIAAGRLSKQKNFAMLLNAFSIFNKAVEGYTLTICGDGELRENLEEQAKELGIQDKVSFLGHVTDVHSRMANAQMYVSTSDYEGMSNSMLEAMAIGLPTICTDCPIGGARMVIDDGNNGFLAPVGEAEIFADKMITLAKAEEMCEKFSTNSVEVCKGMSIESICKRWSLLL